MKFSVSDALHTLHTVHKGQRFLELFQHGSMSVEIYEPKVHDPQQPHLQDEIYVIIEGHGLFQNGSEKYPFGPGDLIFVQAGIEHRFLEFSEDFKTWVIFYGPQGGE